MLKYRRCVIKGVCGVVCVQSSAPLCQVILLSRPVSVTAWLLLLHPVTAADIGLRVTVTSCNAVHTHLMPL
jgi:hypothetical protein